MLRFLADENFNNAIVRSLRRRDPSADVVRVQDTPVVRAPDPDVIAWAHDDDRIILTDDTQTFPGFAHARMRAGGHTAGVFMVHAWMPIGRAIDDLLVAHVASEMSDWVDVVQFFPPVSPSPAHPGLSNSPAAYRRARAT